ncbi:TDP-N-acetylfucosamine:lipid II N-acetylfucosaminyltransferase [Shewanella sp. NIFS-20-20]|uniref:TDP-N-acetylfucosamine:lipid II N-acetylfucosaminyltransferase n=1 Tax=Shewanella sp. NIFS-20-20 TaxID=2853806 RepID=UPI001C45B706|nr:TDP-N-acetylfucosamine:lipid II N-acetylfucosaminyltransferase [Shewanella sp. NIFS-20-20]MBV7316379.1 TDP-N-acetylfucosamine:lipid II N-acetylfucosaminyltransferase [Shewanella sp. NIFS-20-20]
MKKVLHIFWETHHHNLSIIRYFSELSLAEVHHEYLVFDRQHQLDIYDEFAHVPMHFFSLNAQFLPWLREQHIDYDLIIIHGFFNHVLWEVLRENAAICQKTSWLIFGADLLIDDYIPEQVEFLSRMTAMRRDCVVNMKSVLTNICSDVDQPICNDKYGTPSLALKYAYYQDYVADPTELPAQIMSFAKGDNVIVLGNSADVSNRHIDMMAQLLELKHDIRILCPLNYAGDAEYIHRVIEYGQQHFGDRFFALTQLLSNQEYYYLLSLCDGLILAHKRQQAGHHWVYWLKQGKPMWGDLDAPIPRDLVNKGAVINHINQLHQLKDDLGSNRSYQQNVMIYQKFFSKGEIDNLWRNNFNELLA